MIFGDHLQLSVDIISPYDRKGVASQISVSPDKNRGVFFAFKLENFRYQRVDKVIGDTVLFVILNVWSNVMGLVSRWL